MPVQAHRSLRQWHLHAGTHARMQAHWHAPPPGPFGWAGGDAERSGGGGGGEWAVCAATRNGSGSGLLLSSIWSTTRRSGSAVPCACTLRPGQMPGPTMPNAASERGSSCSFTEASQDAKWLVDRRGYGRLCVSGGPTASTGAAALLDCTLGLSLVVVVSRAYGAACPVKWRIIAAKAAWVQTAPPGHESSFIPSTFRDQRHRRSRWLHKTKQRAYNRHIIDPLLG